MGEERVGKQYPTDGLGQRRAGEEGVGKQYPTDGLGQSLYVSFLPPLSPRDL